jgi:hypothetical protein
VNRDTVSFVNFYEVHYRRHASWNSTSYYVGTRLDLLAPLSGTDLERTPRALRLLSHRISPSFNRSKVMASEKRRTRFRRAIMVKNRSTRCLTVDAESLPSL